MWQGVGGMRACGRAGRPRPRPPETPAKPQPQPHLFRRPRQADNVGGALRDRRTAHRPARLGQPPQRVRRGTHGAPAAHAAEGDVRPGQDALALLLSCHGGHDRGGAGFGVRGGGRKGGRQVSSHRRHARWVQVPCQPGLHELRCSSRRGCDAQASGHGQAHFTHSTPGPVDVYTAHSKRPSSLPGARLPTHTPA